MKVKGVKASYKGSKVVSQRCSDSPPAHRIIRSLLLRADYLIGAYNILERAASCGRPLKPMGSL